MLEEVEGGGRAGLSLAEAAAAVPRSELDEEPTTERQSVLAQKRVKINNAKVKTGREPAACLSFTATACLGSTWALTDIPRKQIIFHHLLCSPVNIKLVGLDYHR